MPTPPRQLLVDLSVLVHKDDQSGIQRVVRNLLQALQAAPPEGYRICPVYDAGGYYAYVTQDHFPLASEHPVQPLQVVAGDRFLGLDLCPDLVPGNRALYQDLRRHGVEIYFVVYDLLPVTLPAMFSAGASPWFSRWLETVASVADGLLCISRAVADELLEWIEAAAIVRPDAPRVSYFHLGADLQVDPAMQSAANSQLSASESALLEQLGSMPAFLMVGTLEPRKMHAQALQAFEILWQQEIPAQLVIVGKPGWMTQALVARLERHSELGQRLFWLRHASDAVLLQLYQRCTALLAASAGEGFGLPLIEAAHHGLPILARDLAVFREVCGAHADYFSGDSVALAQALQRWCAPGASAHLPASRQLPHLDWAASAQQLLAALDHQRPYRRACVYLP